MDGNFGMLLSRVSEKILKKKISSFVSLDCSIFKLINVNKYSNNVFGSIILGVNREFTLVLYNSEKEGEGERKVTENVEEEREKKSKR